MFAACPDLGLLRLLVRAALSTQRGSLLRQEDSVRSLVNVDTTGKVEPVRAEQGRQRGTRLWPEFLHVVTVYEVMYAVKAQDPTGYFDPRHRVLVLLAAIADEWDVGLTRDLSRTLTLCATLAAASLLTQLDAFFTGYSKIEPGRFHRMSAHDGGRG